MAVCCFLFLHSGVPTAEVLFSTHIVDRGTQMKFGQLSEVVTVQTAEKGTDVPDVQFENPPLMPTSQYNLHTTFPVIRFVSILLQSW